MKITFLCGIVYDSYITKEQFDNLSSLEKEDALITTAMLEKEKNVNMEKIKTVKIDIPVELEYIVKDSKITNNMISIENDNESIELIVNDIPTDKELYLSINNLKYISDDNRTDFKIIVRLDGITNSENVRNKTSSAYYMNNPNFLMNLGISKEKQAKVLKITFNKKGIYTFDDFEILAVDMKKYEEKIDKLKTNVMQNIEYGNNYIKGIVNSEKDGILQITTSYSDGWKAFVDEEEVEVVKVNEAFIGINVEKGKHTIRFKYETPYLKLGIMFSAVGGLVYISLIIIEVKKRNSVL